MARSAAEHVAALGRPVSALVASPLQRTRESAEPFTELLGLDPVIDERVIEPTNVFEGKRMKRALLNPLNWRHLVRPSIPSWGEPYASIASRMTAAMDAAWESADGGDVVVVSHQAPIWIAHLAIAGEPLRHDPRSRRCALSSVTSFERGPDGTWTEIDYAEPASTVGAVDVGAV
jgi:broad specificity phosphatase PhoE